jgi:uncharacterized protein YukE
MPAPPDPVLASYETFHLDADPAALETAAADLRGYGGQAHSARDTVDGAAGLIELEGSWEGDTATSYQSHRHKLTRDLGSVGDGAVGAADVLDRIAGILRLAQAMLDEQRGRLSAVAVTEREPPRIPHEYQPGGPISVFQPADENEAAMIADAVGVAREIRADVDVQLAEQEAALLRILHGSSRSYPHLGTETTPGLTAISSTWRPREVRVLNLNVGQGFGNVPAGTGDSEDGVDPGDIDEIGRIIENSGTNVVTLQEMFHVNASDLETWLNENTGGQWELHFEAADRKIQWDDAFNLPPWDEDGYNDFGNAVLIRTDTDLGRPTEREPTVLQEPTWAEPDIDVSFHPTPWGPPSVDVDVGMKPEGRVLQHTEVPLDG